MRAHFGRWFAGRGVGADLGYGLPKVRFDVVTAATDRPDPALPGVMLMGLDDPASALVQAYERNRLHHAWLLTGPQGLGKAALAHRFARLLLGAKADQSCVLDAGRDDPAVRLVMAGPSGAPFPLMTPADCRSSFPRRRPCRVIESPWSTPSTISTPTRRTQS